MRSSRLVAPVLSSSSFVPFSRRTLRASRRSTKPVRKGAQALLRGLVLPAVLVASFSGACGGASDTLAEVTALKDKVCACKDAACVAKLKSDSAGLDAKVAKLSGEDMDKALKIAVDMMKCASDLGVAPDGL